MLASGPRTQATETNTLEFSVARLGLSRPRDWVRPPVDWASRPEDSSESTRVNATATLQAISHPTKAPPHASSRELLTIVLNAGESVRLIFS